MARWAWPANCYPQRAPKLRRPLPPQPYANAVRVRTAERRAETYQGPKVVPDSKS